MSIVIADLREEHIESFRVALDAVARERVYLTMLEAPPIEQVRDFLRRSLARSEPHIVALEGSSVVGWCDVIGRDDRPTTRHCGVLGMGVVPAWRGRGIGRHMIERAIEAAHSYGFTRVELAVRDDNPRALALYQKAGFAVEGQRQRALLVDGVYHDLVMMALLLDAGASGVA